MLSRLSDVPNRWLELWLLLLAVCAPSIGLAEDTTDIALDCSSSTDRATITATTTPDTIETGIPKVTECTLGNGSKIRVEVEWGTSMPYGICGGDEDVTIRVWFNKRRWVDKLISGHCMEYPMSTIVVSSHGIRWCTMLNENAALVAHQARTEHCEETPAAKLAGNIDRRVFPRNSTSGPLVGSVVAVYGNDRPLCKALLVHDKARVDPRWMTVAIPADWSIAALNPNTYPQKYRFDIDNDGQADDVRVVASSNHYFDGELFYVSSRSPPPRATPSTSREYWELVGSPYVFPPANSNCAENPCNPRDIDGDFALKHVNWIFSRRYLSLSPFSWRGSTYFLVSSSGGHDGDSLYAVLKPAPNDPPSEECMYKVVRRE